MIYFCLFLLSLLLTYIIKSVALKRSMLDIPNERSSHTTPIPHGGGIAIAFSWFIGLFYLYIYGLIDKDIFYALLLGVFISLVSFFDDIYNLHPKYRLLVQFLISSIALYSLGGLSKIDVYFFIITNQFFTNLFALFMVVWFINLYNFLDGIDGYAGTEAIFLGVGGYLLFGSPVFLVLVASVAGFLVWNWHKAKIFMGDVGSTMLGYNVAIFSIYFANQKFENFWVWIILFGLFWFDATLTLYRRFVNRERLSVAHKKHAYQRLNQSGWSHQRVVVSSIFPNIVLLVLAYLAKSHRDLSFAMFILAIILLYIVVKNIDKKKRFT